MAGRIPQSFINDLIDRLDIVDVVGSRVTLKKTGKNYSGLCPFHDEKTPSFTVSPDKQFFHCFGCQKSGTALGFVMEYDRLDFVEAVEALASQLGLDVPREQSGHYRPKLDDGLLTLLTRAEKFYRQALRTAPHAIEYLRGRGLTGEVARDFGIGYAPPGWQNLQQALSGAQTAQLVAAGLMVENDKGRTYDRFRDRIMFPIRDTKGRVIGFGGRVLPSADTSDGGGPKYMNSPETTLFQKSQELYGLFEARKALRQIDRLIVVEGYMDVVALAQHGIQNAVATLGTASGTAHFTKLYRYTDHVVCCFDGDNAGRQAAWKALENALPTLNEHRQLKFVFLPQGEDPDSMVAKVGKADFQQLLDNAQPAIELLLSRLSQGLDLGTIDGRARFAALTQPHIERLPAGVLRTLVEDRVANMSGLRTSTPAMPRARRSARERQRPSNRLHEHLLTLLVQYPQEWLTVHTDERADLLRRLGEDDSIRLVANYVEDNPSTEPEELLVWFDGTPTGELLSRLIAKRLPISGEQVHSEYEHCSRQLCKQLLAQERRSMLENLKNSPNDEVFRSYLQKRNGSDDYAS